MRFYIILLSILLQDCSQIQRDFNPFVFATDLNEYRKKENIPLVKQEWNAITDSINSITWNIKFQTKTDSTPIHSQKYIEYDRDTKKILFEVDTYLGSKYHNNLDAIVRDEIEVYYYYQKDNKFDREKGFYCTIDTTGTGAVGISLIEVEKKLLTWGIKRIE